jgi:hypothetical protein
VIALSLHGLIEGLVADFLDDSEKIFMVLLGLQSPPQNSRRDHPVVQRYRVKWKITVANGIFFATLSGRYET